jgi:TRAP-type mannitol/chloroaromatic compound transport system permease small subunit
MDLLRTTSDRIGRVADALGWLVGWLVLAMVLVGAFNAVARYLSRMVGVVFLSNGLVDLQWYLFSLVFLLGASYALRRDAHVRVDVLYSRLSVRGKAVVNLLGTLLFLVPFCIYGLVFCWPSVRNSVAVWEQSPDAGGLARWPIKASLLVGFALLLLQGVAQALKHLADVVDPDGAQEGSA